MFVFLALGLCSLADAGSAVPLTFGSGRSQITILAASEFQLLNYTASPLADTGCISFFWITGDPLPGKTASGVDQALWRFYLDGETTASIGPLPTSQAAFIGNHDPSAPWNNDYFGKNSAFGGWHFNLKIPFTKQVRVTLQMPSTIPSQRAFAMVRGVENLPLVIAGYQLPPSARLVASLKTSMNLPVLSFHELVSIPSGVSGLLLGTMIDLQSLDKGSLNSLEGCWHAFTPPTTPYPGLLLGTGAEDYPESAYYFNAGLYRGPTSGLSVMSPGNASWPFSRISFFKLHHQDPVFFRDGFRFTWRNGDVTDPQTGEKCTVISGTPIGSPGVSNVSTLAYVYTWKE